MKLRAPAPIVIATILVIAVSTALALSAGPLFSRLEAAASLAVGGRVAELLDGLEVEASYESASPRLLGSVSLRGVELRSRGAVVARLGAAELRYGLASALRGNFTVSSVRLEDLSIDASYAELASLAERATRLVAGAAPEPAGETGLRTPAPGPAIELRRVRARLGFDGGAYAEADIRAIDLVLEGDSIRASGSGTLRASDPERRFGAARAEAPFSVTTSVRIAPDGTSASISAVLAGDSDLGRLSSTRVTAEFDAAGVRASIEPNDRLRRLEAAWNDDEKRLTVDAEFSRWAPASMFAPAAGLASLSPWLEAPYSGSLWLSTDLSAEGTDARVDLRSVLPLDMPGGHPRVAVTGSGSWRTFAVRSASLKNSAIDVSYAGDVFPASLGARGLLSLSYAIGPGLEAEADFELSGSGSSWFAYAPAIRASDAELRDATVSVEFSDASLSYYIDAALPYLAVERAAKDPEVPAEPIEAASAPSAPRLVIEGAASLGDDAYVEAAIRFGAVHGRSFPALLEALVGPEAAPILAPFSVEGELAVYSDFSGLSYNSSGLLIVYDGAAKGFGVVGFSGGLGRLTVSSIEASVAGYAVTGSASVDYGNRAGAGFEADIRVQDLPYSVSGAVIDSAVIVSGDYGLRFSARGEEGAYGASLEVTDMPIPLLGTVSFLSASSHARFSSLADWDVVIDELSLSQPPGAPKPLPAVTASGAFDEAGGRFGRLTYKDKISALEGVADVTWALEDGFRVSANVRMTGADGEYYSVNGEYRGDGGIDAVASMRKAPLARLAVPALRGVLDADSTIAGTVADPALRFGFTVNGGQRADNLPFAAGSGSYGGRVLTLSDTRIRLGAQSLSGLSLRYGIDDAALEATAIAELSLGANAFYGKLVASGASSARDGAASPFLDYAASGAIEDARWADGELGDIPFSLRTSSGDLRLSLGDADELLAELGSDGGLGLSLSRSLPISFSADGKYSEGAISLDVADAVVEMPFLFKLIGLPMVRVESGVGRGSLRVRGRLVDPTVEGVVDLENFYLSVPDFVSAPIGPLSAPLYFTGSTMETLQSDVACGDASLAVSLRSPLHGWLPDDISLSVKSVGKGLVPVSMRLLGLDIVGLAKPDLLIEANADRARIGGAVEMSSGDIVLTTGLVKQKGSSSGASDFSGSLDLSFGKAVRVYFPDKRLPVLYGQADPSSRLDLDFDVARGDFSLKGVTTLRGGSVFYVQRNFYLRHATISFDEDADRFDPLISAEAETRSSTGSGPVLVTIRAVDSRLSNLSFALESVPSMSEADILSLLGHNLLGGAGGQGVNLGKALVENSDLIPQLNVASILERNLQEILGLDFFVVRSQVFQRWLYDVSGLAGDSIGMTLGDYLDDTAIVGGKYIGDKLFFQVMLTLVSLPLASTSALSLDSDISLEWKAPHFTLNWSVQPKNLDSLFIEDQTFSFLWRIPLQ